jgi:G3E family GTPase
MILGGVVDGARVTDFVDLRGVISVLDVGCWLPDAGGAEPLRERGLAGPVGDKRTMAQLGVAHAECADLLVYAGAAEQWLQARTGAVLARLNPLAARISTADLDSRVFLDGLPAGARRGRRESRHAPLLRGQPPLDPCAGVQLMMFTARRPFHPERLHRAIGVLLDGDVVRTRGRIWLAPSPESVFWLQSAGGSLGIGYVGDWLAAGDARAWQAADPERHAQAALRWHHRWGDRAQDLAILVHEGDPARIEAALREALLTDGELATGEQSWRNYPDPFGLWHTDPCEDTTTQPAHRPRGRRPNRDDRP